MISSFSESFVWVVRIEALSDCLNAGLAGAFRVDFLVQDSFTEARFQFCAPLLVWDGTIFDHDVVAYVMF